MVARYSAEMAGSVSTPPVKANLPYGGRLRCYRATIALAAQASGDTILLAKPPAGAAFAFGVINTDTSLGTATLAIGDSTSAGRLRTAAVHTATNTPTQFGNVGGVTEGALSAQKDIIATIGTAALPGTGTLIIDLYYLNG